MERINLQTLKLNGQEEDYSQIPPRFKLWKFYQIPGCPSDVNFRHVLNIRRYVFLADSRREINGVKQTARFEPRLLWLNAYGGLYPMELYLSSRLAAAGDISGTRAEALVKMYEQMMQDRDTVRRCLDYVRRIQQ